MESLIPFLLIKIKIHIPFTTLEEFAMLENNGSEVITTIKINEVDYDVLLDMIQFAFKNGNSVDQIIKSVTMLGINGFTDNEFEEDMVVLIRIISEAISRDVI